MSFFSIFKNFGNYAKLLALRKRLDQERLLDRSEFARYILEKSKEPFFLPKHNTGASLRDEITFVEPASATMRVHTED